MEKGLRCSGSVCYGYRASKEEKGEWVIDEEALTPEKLARLEAHRRRKKITREKLILQAETDPAAAAELAKKRAYSSEATKKSRQKMYEEAATGNPEAVERYENYLASRRKHTTGKNRKQREPHSRPV